MKPTGNLIVDGMVQIVAAHVGQNPIDSGQLPNLMRQVSNTLIECIKDASSAIGGETQIPSARPASAPVARATVAASPAAPAAPAAPVVPANPPTAREAAKEAAEARRKDLPTNPAVPINKSVQKDAIICLFDGEPRKMLSRHLLSKYGMRPDEYRAYWNLPDDYPMTAPGYSDEKRIVAVSQGLGTHRSKKKAAKSATRKSRKSA